MTKEVKMCLLCIEIAKDSIKPQDFVKNFIELANTDPEHARELVDKYEDKVNGLIFTEELD